MICDGKVKIVADEIMHDVCDNLGEFIQKNLKYLLIWVKQKSSEGKKPSIMRMIFSPLYRFYRDFFHRLGFLDGILGLTLALSTAYITFLKYALLFINNKNSEKRNTQSMN